MSVKVSAWVWHEAPKTISGNELVVLLSLADVADDAGNCVYFVESSAATREALAAKARVSVATFKRVVQKLSERGVLVVERGRQHAPNSYRIVLIQGVQVEPSEDSRGFKTGIQTVQKVGSDGSTVTRLKEDVDVVRIRALFDLFWAAYPRHIAKAAAFKKFEVVVRSTDAQVVIAAAQRFAGEADLSEPRFIPHPATWLNQGRWEDESSAVEVVEVVEDNATLRRLAREEAEQKAAWLAARGVTEAEWEARKHDRAWVESLIRKAS